jgi:hypothetical protein
MFGYIEMSEIHHNQISKYFSQLNVKDFSLTLTEVTSEMLLLKPTANKPKQFVSKTGIHV